MGEHPPELVPTLLYETPDGINRNSVYKVNDRFGIQLIEERGNSGIITRWEAIYTTKEAAIREIERWYTKIETKE